MVRRTEADDAESHRLLNDIGRSGARQLGRDNPVEELMRLSADPLWLHGFLHREERERRIPGPMFSASVLTVAITPGSPHSGDRQRYGAQERLSPESLEPEAFVPTFDDFRLALEASEPPSGPRPPSHHAFQRAILYGVMAGALLVMLLLA